MGGIDPTVISHRLNTSPSFKPVKEKRRSFEPERQKAINEEVGKLLQAGAIREVKYLEWLANVVLIKKENGKWRLCIDFTDIKKHVQRIASLCQGSTSSWTPQLAMNFSVSWTPSPACTRTTKNDLICHSARILLLSSNAIRTRECRSHISEVGKQDVPEADWHNQGGLHRRHASKVHHSRAPHFSPL